MTTKLYVAGTTLWILALAVIADYNPFDDITDLTGQSLFY